MRLILMLRLWDGAFFDIAASFTDVHGLAWCLTSSFSNNHALVSMIQCVFIIGLDHLATFRTHHAVITYGYTGRRHGIMTDKMMRTVLIAAISTTVGILAITIRVSAATTAGTV